MQFNQGESTMTMNELIAKLNGLGIKTYQRTPKDTWLICELDGNLGYIQLNRGYYKVSTIHKPKRDIGTGFSLDENTALPFKNDVLRMFCLAPSWASSRDLQSVEKFNSIDQYKSYSARNAAYEIVKPKEQAQ
jgi:hypothetical protein